MPNVVRVFAVIQGVKGSMRLGITTDDQLVVVAREVIQLASAARRFFIRLGAAAVSPSDWPLPPDASPSDWPLPAAQLPLSGPPP